MVLTGKGNQSNLLNSNLYKKETNSKTLRIDKKNSYKTKNMVLLKQHIKTKVNKQTGFYLKDKNDEKERKSMTQ